MNRLNRYTLMDKDAAHAACLHMLRVCESTRDAEIQAACRTAVETLCAKFGFAVIGPSPFEPDHCDRGLGDMPIGHSAE